MDWKKTSIDMLGIWTCKEYPEYEIREVYVGHEKEVIKNGYYLFTCETLKEAKEACVEHARFN